MERAAHTSLLKLREDILDYLEEKKNLISVPKLQDSVNITSNVINDTYQNSLRIPTFGEFLDYIISSNLQGNFIQIL